MDTMTKNTQSSKLVNLYVVLGNKGADSTGTVDCSTVLQSEINRMADAGGGNLVVQDGKYLLNSPITVPDNVSLGFGGYGPFEATSNPSVTARAPTFIINHDDDPAFTLAGPGAGIADVQFWYLGQVSPSSSTPVQFPATVKFASGTGSQKVERCTFGNSYIGIDIQSGRSSVSDCLIGAFSNDINIDNAFDWVELHNIKCQVMWNVFAGALPFPMPVDTWVMNNSIALKTGRVDSLQASNFSVYGRNTGHKIIDSVNTALNPRAGYGRLTNVDFDFVAYGIDATSTNNSAYGFSYENASFGANGSGAGQAGQAVLRRRSGGTQAPIISIVGGHARGSWSAGYPYISDDIASAPGSPGNWISDVRGINKIGEVGATLPASGVQGKNFYPFPVDVYLVGGTITDVQVNSLSVGPRSVFRLQPFETFTVTYTGTPTAVWRSN